MLQQTTPSKGFEWESGLALPGEGAAFNGDAPSILFVDDEPSICSLMEAYFRLHGFEVTTASEMEEAEALLKLRRFHIVVTDLGLTGLNRLEGLKVLQEARYLWPHLQIVVMTGWADPAVREECLESGADAFLAKPTRASDVHSLVQSLLGKGGRQ
jgi:DNA-binding response OmpR family regulator